MAGWRGLAVIGGAVVLLLTVAGGVLQVLGPPPGATLTAEVPARQQVTPAAQPAIVPEARRDLHTGHVNPSDTARPAMGAVRPGRGTPGPIADPDPGMLEPVASDPRLMMPRISIDGRASMAAYAGGFDPSTLRPRVGLLIAGIGLNEADSIAAIKILPGGVTLAIDPSARNLSRLLAAARSNEHEYLLSLPLEPQRSPINNKPHNRRVPKVSGTSLEDMTPLDAILGRVTGYAGVTNALGAMQGGRVGGAAEVFDPVLRELAKLGLFFLDARPAAKPLPYAWNRSVDMVMDDDPFDASTLDRRLDALAHLAQIKGSALGVASVSRAVTVERVAAWASMLTSKGLALAPASALMLPPAKQDQEK